MSDEAFGMETLERSVEGRGERGARGNDREGEGETIRREGVFTSERDLQDTALRGCGWPKRQGEESSLGPRDGEKGRAPRGLINVGDGNGGFVWATETARDGEGQRARGGFGSGG